MIQAEHIPKDASLADATEPTRRRIGAALESIAPGYDIARIYLFGSRARGEATSSSDVDLCLETGPSFSLFQAGGFASSLEGELGVPIDIVTERSVYPHVRRSMLEERTLVYERV